MCWTYQYEFSSFCLFLKGISTCLLSFFFFFYLLTFKLLRNLEVKIMATQAPLVFLVLCESVYVCVCVLCHTLPTFRQAYNTVFFFREANKTLSLSKLSNSLELTGGSKPWIQLLIAKHVLFILYQAAFPLFGKFLTWQCSRT